MGSVVSTVCLAMMAALGLQYIFFGKTKGQADRANPDYQAKPGPAVRNRGESSFGEIAANNSLAFVRNKAMTPEQIQEEMAKKQFRIEYRTAVVRGPPEAEAMKKKWSKEPKKTMKDLQKTMSKKGIEIKKSDKRFGLPGQSAPATATNGF